MANIVTNGFRCIGSIFGPAAIPATLRREIASSYGTALYNGDPLIQVSDGTAAITSTGTSNYVLGVSNGFSRIVNGVRQNVPYWPASTVSGTTGVGSIGASYVYYVPAMPGVLFEVDGDDGTTAATMAAAVGLIGENCDATVAAGDTTTGITGTLLNLSGHATTTLPWRVVDVVDRADNDPTLTHFKFIVTAKQSFWTGIGLAGV